VTLVGHSLGGIAVAAAAEKNAQDVARIIYLGGYVPSDGESIDSLSDVVLDKEAVILGMQAIIRSSIRKPASG
jgi:pimeloyl-ACP methyl ester carboxylesterase